MDNERLVTCQSCDALGLFLGLPEVHCEVIRATDENFSTLIECLIISLHSVLLHFFNAFSRRATELFLLVIETSSSEDVISAKGEAVDPVSMSFQLTLHDASVSFPDLDRPVL